MKETFLQLRLGKIFLKRLNSNLLKIQQHFFQVYYQGLVFLGLLRNGGTFFLFYLAGTRICKRGLFLKY